MYLDKMKFTILVLALALNLSLVNVVEGKRAFAIRMRSKSNNGGTSLSRNSRKNFHQHHPETVGSMVRNPPVPDPQQARPIGWSMDANNHSPIGPPPAYPGLGHHAVPAGGAPPAYSYSKINPPSYAEAVGHQTYAVPAGVAPRHYDYNHNNALYSDNTIGAYGSSYGYQRGSNPFSMGSILTGAALWHAAHGLGHSHNHHHTYHSYYDHPNHHQDGPAEQIGSTLPPEVENPHIQVNANFDFGPSPNPQESTTVRA